MAHILALIPAYNEAERIADVIAGARRHLSVLVVDDGSTDETAARAEAAGATVLRQVPNQGKGAALKAGFRAALDEGCDAVIMLDADGQHDPDEIPAFLAAYEAHQPDLIIGERRFTQMPFPRNLSNTIGRWIFSWAVGQTVRDNQSGYRLVSRRLMEAMLASAESGFEFEVEMIAIAIARGWHVEGVPIRTIYRGEGSHIRPLAHIANYFRIVRHIRRIMRAARGEPARRLAPGWIALVVILLVALAVIAVLLSNRDGGSSDGPERRAPGTFYPNDGSYTDATPVAFANAGTTPLPVTFIPPTPVPTNQPPPTPFDPLIGQPVPDVTLPIMDGEPVRLRDLEGEIVFLNFWATWCAPCKEEMPLLQQLQDEHDNVRVITITDPQSGQTEDDIRAFMDTYNLTLPVALWTDRDAYEIFGVMALPTTFVIDQRGIIRYRQIGAMHQEDIALYVGELSR